MRKQKKKFLAVLCFGVLSITLFSSLVFALYPFNATFNGNSGTKTTKLETKDNAYRYAYVEVTGYNTSGGSTSVSFKALNGSNFRTETKTVYGKTSVKLYYVSDMVPAKGKDKAQLSISAGSNVIGVGGYWAP